MHTWDLTTQSAPDEHFYASMHCICIIFAYFCTKCALCLHFYQQCIVSRQIHCWFADNVQNTCRLRTLCADLVQTLSSKVCTWRTLHTWTECAKSAKIKSVQACTLCTPCHWCAKSAVSVNPSQANLAKNCSNPTHMHRDNVLHVLADACVARPC